MRPEQISAIGRVAHSYFNNGVTTGVTGLDPRDQEHATEMARRTLGNLKAGDWTFSDYEKAAQMFAAALSQGTCDPANLCWCDCHQAAYRPEAAPPCSSPDTCRLRLAAPELAGR